jgi:hypothetical protein
MQRRGKDIWRRQLAGFAQNNWMQQQEASETIISDIRQAW